MNTTASTPAAAPASDLHKNLRMCAYCPNTCRPSYAAAAPLQMESHTPSAMALVALACLEGRLPYAAGVAQVMQRHAALRASRGHCTYGLDMPAVIEAALGAMQP